MARVGSEMHPADLAFKKHFSIRPLDGAQAREIVRRATAHPEPGESIEVIEDALELYERLRHYCNALNDFAHSVELGIYASRGRLPDQAGVHAVSAFH